MKIESPSRLIAESKAQYFPIFFDSVYNSVAYVPVKVRMGSESKTTNQSQYPVSSTVHLIGVFVRTCSQLFPTSNAISDETLACEQAPGSVGFRAR